MGNQNTETKPGPIKLIWFFDAPLTVAFRFDTGGNGFSREK